MKKIQILSFVMIVLACAYGYGIQMQGESEKSEQTTVVESSVDTEKNGDRLVETFVVEQKIQLFMYDGCPYCVKVRDFLQQHDLVNAFEFIDAGIVENRELLRSISGKTQAPYLVDRDAGVSMPESLDIIAYIAKKFNIVVAQVINRVVERHDDAYDAATFLADVTSSKLPVIVLVSTTWCPPCKIFKPLFLQIAEQYVQNCRFMCIDGDANAEILHALGISSYPSVVCFKHGKQINPVNYRSVDGMQRLVQQLIAD